MIYKKYNVITFSEYKNLEKINNVFECSYFSCSFKKNHLNAITFTFEDEINIFINLEESNYRKSKNENFIAGFDGINIYVGVKDEI